MAVDEFPGHNQTVKASTPKTQETPQQQQQQQQPVELVDSSPLQLEKSNILLMGPSGVGKTLMAKTLARVLSVPFSISDCTSFTQAGYIGEDAEVCVHRLLAASNYDVEQAERGIIVLDEVDKIAAAKVSHGKDVSGEGAQQALLKIIEGTTVQVQAKQERNSSSPHAGGGGTTTPNTYPSNSPLGNPPYSPPYPGAGGGGGGMGSGGAGPGGGPSPKGEIYNVRTDNILFIFSGAFVGLHKVIMDRISRGSIGFGQPMRSASAIMSRSNDRPGAAPGSSGEPQEPIPILPGSEEESLYKTHLPFFTPAAAETASCPDAEPTYFNALDLATPTDLQSYGFIPELVGRIPVTAALGTLTHNLLLRILTEPRNSLLAQYTTLFSLSGIELRFTTAALHRIASNAFKMGTGARALRTELESILGDAMFETPGSSVKFVLVTAAVAQRNERAVYLARGQGSRFHSMITAEESEWEQQQQQQQNQSQSQSQEDAGYYHASSTGS